MSRSYKHKIEAKFKNELIEYKDVPFCVRLKWYRHNYNGGCSRKLKAEIKEKIISKQTELEVNQMETNILNKEELLKDYTLTKMGSDTVIIQNREFSFMYTIADRIMKEEFKGMYRYCGGLQCGYKSDTKEYELLESWLIEIAEKVLEIKNTNTHERKL